MLWDCQGRVMRHSVMRHSATPQRRCGGWPVHGLLALLATIGVALSVALLPAAALAASSPSVIQTSYSNVTSDSVKLEAQINPGGSPTTYQLEYNYADGVECEVCKDVALGLQKVGRSQVIPRKDCRRWK